jgi:SAM-dependent methyltransferase
MEIPTLVESGLCEDWTMKKKSIEPIKLDLGCGPGKKAGFTGVDQTAFPGVDIVHDLKKKWPWKDGSIEEVHSGHFLEHLDSMERIHFYNELHRVLKPGAKATIITPHWASCRAYGDPTHKWPPVSEFAWYYLKRDWRMANAPHADITNLAGGFACNFEVTWGYGLEPGVAARNQEYQQHAMTYFKEAISDMFATLVKV